MRERLNGSEFRCFLSFLSGVVLTSLVAYSFRAKDDPATHLIEANRVSIEDPSFTAQLTKGWSTASPADAEPVTRKELDQAVDEIRTLTGSYLETRRWLLMETVQNRKLEALLAEFEGDPSNTLAAASKAEREELEAAPRVSLNFERERLRDVLAVLAEAAGIEWFSSEPASTLDEEFFVTFSMEASPFSMLETVANTHGYSLMKEGDAWMIRQLTDRNPVRQQLQWIDGFLRTAERADHFDRDSVVESINHLAGIPTHGWTANSQEPIAAGNDSGTSAIGRLITAYERLHPGTDLVNFVPRDFLFNPKTRN